MEEHPKHCSLLQLVQSKDDPILKKLTEKTFTTKFITITSKDQETLKKKKNEFKVLKKKYSIMTFILLAIEDSRLWEQSMSAFAWCKENLMGRIDKPSEIA